MACRICGDHGEHRVHRVPEMMFGTGETFDYIECGACGCLQISEIPEDMSRHYPPEYYAFESGGEETERRGLRSHLERRWLRRFAALSIKRVKSCDCRNYDRRRRSQ